jgi:hypothetical protein
MVMVRAQLLGDWTRAAPLGALLGVALTGATAGAQTPVATPPADAPSRPVIDGEELAEEPTLVGGAEVGIFAERRADADVASVSPRLELGIRPHPQVEILAGFGAVATVINTPTERESSVRSSNISVAASRVQRWGTKFREAKVGFAFSLPTSSARTPEERAGYDYALGGRAGWNPWEWTPTTLGLIIPAQIRAQIGRRWVVGGDAAIGGMFASVDNTAPPAVAAQGAGLARLVTRWVGLGARVTAVYNGQRTDDRSQVAVSPFADASLCRRGGRRVQGTFARATAQCPVFATAAFNVNLDAPFGLVSRNDAQTMRVWGLVMGLGWAVF